MTATDLAVAPTLRSVEAIIQAIRNASSIHDVTEARARAEAMRAWLKVHGMASKYRLELLRVEVDALVRVVQLGGLDQIPKRDRAAARYLADLSSDDRERLLQNSGAATTAVGMVQTIWRIADIERQANEERERGRRYARSPEPPKLRTEDDLDVARWHVAGIGAALGDMIETFTKVGMPFSVSDFAESVIERAGSSREISDDPDLMAGVRDVVREAIRRQPVLEFEDYRIPRFVTTRLGEGQYVRVPTENATVAHLLDGIAMRREQIDQDMAALQGLESFAKKLMDLPGADERSRIGDLIARSVTDPAA